MTSTLTTNGLIAPEGFPTIQYEKIHQRVSTTQKDNAFYQHFAGAWNGLSYRYRAALDHGDAFILSLQKHGTAPPPEQRYLQEKLLFDFFGASFSCFESTFYAFYTVGAFLSPQHFNLSTPRDQQKVSPNRTKDAYEEAFSSDVILSVILQVFTDPEYQKLREIRNVLTHRTAPGRTMYVSLGSDDTPATEWKLNNSPMDSSIITHSQKELSRLLEILLDAFSVFVSARLT